MPRFLVTDTPILDAPLRAAWDRTRGDDPVFASPYFAPEFYEAIAGVTRSARLVIVEDAGQPIGFLPFQWRPAGMCGPVGGHLNDIHGFIARAGFEVPPEQLLQSAGLPMLSLRHAPIGSSAIGARFGRRHPFHVMDLGGGFSAYEARREPYAKSAFRAIRTRREKARAQFGSVTHVFKQRDPAALKQLIAWKGEQFSATGQANLFDVSWVRELVDRLHSSRDQALGGQLSCLYFGDRLVAAHFGLRSRGVLHYWFPGYDPAVAELSPGNILLHAMAEEAAREGCTAIHLGAGDYRYKQEFADCNFAVTDGVAFARSFIGRTAAAAGLALAQIDRVLPDAVAGLPGRALRRLDRQLSFKAA